MRRGRLIILELKSWKSLKINLKIWKKTKKQKTRPRAPAIYDLSTHPVIYSKDVGLSDIFLNENNECIIHYLCKMSFEKRLKILEGICPLFIGDMWMQTFITQEVFQNSQWSVIFQKAEQPDSVWQKWEKYGPYLW